MKLNKEKYLPYLDGMDLNEEEKTETLETLWRMMEAQADKAWGLHSVQLVMNERDKNR